MSGQRAYPRFGQVAKAEGRVRISRDVLVHLDQAANEISILGDAPGVVGEELTLAMVTAGGEIELRVKVLESRPHVTVGRVRHLVRVKPLTTSTRAVGGTLERSE